MKRGMVIASVAGPALLGEVLAVLLAHGVLPNRVIVGTFSVDLSALAAIGGGLLSVIVGGVVLLKQWVRLRVAQAEASVRAAQAATRRRFLRRLDHELKNPLAILRLGVANLENIASFTHVEAQTLARVSEQVGRLEALVAGLRWLAELEETEIERQPVDLHAVLEEAVTLAYAGGGPSERKVTVHIQQVPWPVGGVQGDHDLLVVAFRNLLDNALKFTQAEDQVEVRAFEDGRWAVVEVADTGPGIPAADLPHIFEELYRGRNAREVPGSGLGLALVERIVTLHGGKVAVRSREGQGTVVTIRLPLAVEG